MERRRLALSFSSLLPRPPPPPHKKQKKKKKKEEKNWNWHITIFHRSASATSAPLWELLLQLYDHMMMVMMMIMMITTTMTAIAMMMILIMKTTMLRRGWWWWCWWRQRGCWWCWLQQWRGQGQCYKDDGLPQQKRPPLPSPLLCYALQPSLVLSVMMMTLIFLILESTYIYV